MNSLNYFSLSPRGRAKSSDSYALPCYTTTRYTVQTGVLKVKQEEADEKDEDGKKSAEEEVEEPPAKAVASAKRAKGGKKGKTVARRRLLRMLLQWQSRFPPLSHLWGAVASAPALLLRVWSRFRTTIRITCLYRACIAVCIEVCIHVFRSWGIAMLVSSWTGCESRARDPAPVLRDPRMKRPAPPACSAAVTVASRALGVGTGLRLERSCWSALAGAHEFYAVQHRSGLRWRTHLTRSACN